MFLFPLGVIIDFRHEENLLFISILVNSKDILLLIKDFEESLEIFKAFLYIFKV